MPARLAVHRPTLAQVSFPILAGAAADIFLIDPNPLCHMGLDRAGVGIRELARATANAHASPAFVSFGRHSVLRSFNQFFEGHDEPITGVRLLQLVEFCPHPLPAPEVVDRFGNGMVTEGWHANLVSLV